METQDQEIVMDTQDQETSQEVDPGQEEHLLVEEEEVIARVMAKRVRGRSYTQNII